MQEHRLRERAGVRGRHRRRGAGGDLPAHGWFPTSAPNPFNALLLDFLAGPA